MSALTSLDKLRPLGYSGRVLLSLAALVWAQSTPPSVVAVFPVEDRSAQFEPNEVDQVTDFLSAEVVRTGRYTVVPRAELDNALKLQKDRSYAACIDENCQIELGRELAAQKILQTRLLRIGQQCLLTQTLYDLRTATAEWARSERVECRLESFLAGIERLADTLGLASATPSLSPPTRSSTRTQARVEIEAPAAPQPRSPSLIDAWLMVAPSLALTTSGFYGGGAWLELLRLRLGQSGLVWSIIDGGVLAGSGRGGSFRSFTDGLSEHRSFHLSIHAGSRLSYQVALGDDQLEASLGAGVLLVHGDTASYDRGAYFALSPGLSYRVNGPLRWGVGLRSVIPLDESCDGSTSISASVSCSGRGPARFELQLPVWF